MASLREQIEAAFEYRGFATMKHRDGTEVVGFVYDRSPTHVEMFDEACKDRLRWSIAEIVEVSLTGEDYAERAQRVWERHAKPIPAPAASDALAGPVLIAVALPIELRAVARALRGRVAGGEARGTLAGLPAVAACVGMGGGGAARAIAAHHPSAVISCGLAGALAGELRCGDLVVASSITDELGDTLSCPPPLWQGARDALGARAGAWLTASSVVATRAAKAALVQVGRIAVDLESWPIARAASRAGVPHVGIRAILDPLDRDLPELVAGAVPGALAALAYVAASPRHAVELVQLAMATRTALRALTAALPALAPLFARSAGATT